MQLTERDREIIRQIYRHRVLKSSHLISLLPGSAQQLLRRLKLLYHHGYLERPRSQLDFYYKGGLREIVYALGNKGASLLEQELGIGQLAWDAKNCSIGRIFIEHALLVSDVMVAIELACRQRDVRLITDDQLALGCKAGSKRELFRWKVNVDKRLKLSVIPDRAFALEFTNQTGSSERAFFFLEADRGTMPVTRRNFSQTSFYRKLLAYEATWSQSIHRTRFDFHRFRVLTVTTIPARVKSLVDACSRLKGGHGLFLFADRAIIENPVDLFSAKWHTGKQGETSCLLN
ncbi:MAG: replication-relaxation family protein [Verrucomicrobiota bacterium]